MTATTADKTRPAANDEQSKPVIVVDVRKKQSKKRIKALRKGKGRLLEQVTQMVEDLRSESAIDGAAQPIVLVVREKSKGLQIW